MIRQLEHNLTDLAAGLIPWLAPLPSAWLVGNASVKYLAWPVPVAIVAAAIVEGLGLSSVATVLELREYNQGKRKSDPAAPAWLAAVLAGVYLLAAISLTVLLDLVPSLAHVAPALFPVLSITGAVLLALRADHRRRLAGIQAEKAERKAERQERKLAGNFPRTDRQLSGKTDWRLLPADDRALIANMPSQAIQSAYGVSERTARNWRAAARNNGNGHHPEEV